ncbi:MAG: TDP-N-acetylfucosamine:lipid II N-acetylfucosaminyltransferase [Cellvibrionaceae bacterium]
MKYSGQIVHLFGWDQKFVPPFIAYIQAHFPVEDHHFIIYGATPDGELPNSKHVTQYPSLLKNLKPLLRHMRSAGKIILHGLFSSHMYYALAMHPWLLRKCYWVIWGGDLYIHNADRDDWRHRKNEWLRRFMISRLGHFVTYIKGDYELARQWYNARGKYHECMMYPSNVFDPQILANTQGEKEVHSGQNILVGNSADPSNNHIEVLEKLLPYKGQDIRIYVPLSYGDQGHAQKVIEQGSQRFDDKFIPITSFMKFDKYLRFLESIDIAIFNHRRQQAMGITITLLALGKTIYMRSDVNQWKYLTEVGMYLKSVSELSLTSLSEKEAMENAKLARSYFSKKRLAEQLSDIFRS